MHRSERRLDPMACLLFRREFQALVDKPDTVLSFYAYADGSPVTGYELQSMLFDIAFSDGRIERVVMPAMGLQYGSAGALDKAIAFLWSLFLLVGTEHAMKFFIERMVSITIDMGIEFSMADLPDMTSAFCANLRGVPLSEAVKLVDHNKKVFGRAVRFPGWGHCFGNLMNTAMKVTPEYPQYLEWCRGLCRFFSKRNLARAFGAHISWPRVRTSAGATVGRELREMAIRNLIFGARKNFASAHLV